MALADERLTAAAPHSVRDRLATIGSHERLDVRQVLFERDTRVEPVVFRIFGACALLAVTAGDRIVEVATIGNAGLPGQPGRPRRSPATRS
jgi:hypothetical protein